MTDLELIDAFVAWRDDIDSIPFAYEAAWRKVPAVKPGWCVLHGLREPCPKCNTLGEAT